MHILDDLRKENLARLHRAIGDVDVEILDEPSPPPESTKGRLRKARKRKQYKAAKRQHRH